MTTEAGSQSSRSTCNRWLHVPLRTGDSRLWWCLELPEDLAVNSICMTFVAIQHPELQAHAAWQDFIAMHFERAVDDALDGRREPLLTIRRLLRTAVRRSDGLKDSDSVVSIQRALEAIIPKDMVREMERKNGGIRGGRFSEATLNAVDVLMRAREMADAATQTKKFVFDDTDNDQRHEAPNDDQAAKIDVINLLQKPLPADIPRLVAQLAKDARRVAKKSRTLPIVLVQCDRHMTVGEQVQPTSSAWCEWSPVEADTLATARTVLFRYRAEGTEPTLALPIEIPNAWRSIMGQTTAP